ncbi:hypothetical protein [Staphylococcus haemolyticus]|nr:hypothetical protein [Staphylococcus haemolyticus]
MLVDVLVDVLCLFAVLVDVHGVVHRLFGVLVDGIVDGRWR